MGLYCGCIKVVWKVVVGRDYCVHHVCEDDETMHATKMFSR